MACQRSLEIDLAGFLERPRAGEFAEFREHYPGCADCSAELRAWTELHESLRAHHPEPEQLASYAELGGSARAAIDRHARSCPACREELRLLSGFAAPLPAAAPRATGSLRALPAALGRLLWSPVFAYGVALLLLAPFVYRGVVSAPEWPDPESAILADESAAPERARPQAPLARADAPSAPPAPAQSERRAREGASRSADAEAAQLDSRAAPSLPQAEDTASAERKAAPSRAAPAAPVPRAAEPAQAPPAESLARKEWAGVHDEADPRMAFDAVSELEEAVASRDATAGGGRASPTAHPGSRLWLPVDPAQAELRVRFALPAPAAAPGWARMRVLDEGRSRELAQEVEVAAGAGELVVALPSAWLLPGSYRVELVLPGAADAPPLRYPLGVAAGP